MIAVHRVDDQKSNQTVAVWESVDTNSATKLCRPAALRQFEQLLLRSIFVWRWTWYAKNVHLLESGT